MIDWTALDDDGLATVIKAAEIVVKLGANGLDVATMVLVLADLCAEQEARKSRPVRV